VLRIGQEVFLCQRRQPNAQVKIYVFYGVVFNSKHPEYSTVRLFYCTSDSIETKVGNAIAAVKTAALLHVARIPGGKASPENDELLQLSNPAVVAFLHNARTGGLTFSRFDGGIKPQKQTGMNTRNLNTKKSLKSTLTGTAVVSPKAIILGTPEEAGNIRTNENISWTCKSTWT
jgi:hypothetical protein